MLNAFLRWYFKKKAHALEANKARALAHQEQLLRELVHQGADTFFGHEHGFSSIRHYDGFRKIPVQTYEQLFPYIEKILRGEANVLWRGKIKWFAKSSGTTNAKSKFIPLTKESIYHGHFKGGQDIYASYVQHFPSTKLWTGKGLGIGGSYQRNEWNEQFESFYGDVSGVLMRNLPTWAEYVRTPKASIALMNNWEEKLEKMARETMPVNVTHLAGVPTWTVLLLQKILELNNQKQIADVWKNVEVFFHGAVHFTPYKSLLHSLIGKDDMRYIETYNASEGFFAYQDNPHSDDMLLLTNHGIFYEFIPMEKLHQATAEAIPLSAVQMGKNYALVISTNGGLWRYLIGDTVRFTSLNPYKIKITGRTKHFINAFGEEFMVENAETAIASACHATHAKIDNYTVAPIYIQQGSGGGHEWIIEFVQPPKNIEQFADVLDQSIRAINSDYDAKRRGDMALAPPRIHVAPPHTFYQWMKTKGKLGGQHKVPRLSNTREYVDELLGMMSRAQIM